MAAVERELVTIFADDNELVGRDWMGKVERVFRDNEDVCAFWCRLSAGPADPPLNKYFALIQNEPLSFFINRYLDGYLETARERSVDGSSYRVFDVVPGRPLVWGANGLTYRTKVIQPIWDVDSYLGDNDAFQIMLERGERTVAYSRDINVAHHHVATLREWRAKWKRNFERHFLAERKSRNLGWLYVPHFKLKLLCWTIYSLIPLFSGADAVYRAIREGDPHWLYHPAATFLQAVTYLKILFFAPEGREFLRGLATGRDG